MNWKYSHKSKCSYEYMKVGRKLLYLCSKEDPHYDQQMGLTDGNSCYLCSLSCFYSWEGKGKRIDFLPLFGYRREEKRSCSFSTVFERDSEVNE